MNTSQKHVFYDIKGSLMNWVSTVWGPVLSFGSDDDDFITSGYVSSTWITIDYVGLILEYVIAWFIDRISTGKTGFA